MTYKILNTQANEETITTTVEYNFDGVVVTVDIPHFMPQSELDIETGILNRAASEKRKLDSTEFNKTLLLNIPIGEEKPIQDIIELNKTTLSSIIVGEEKPI